MTCYLRRAQGGSRAPEPDRTRGQSPGTAKGRYKLKGDEERRSSRRNCVARSHCSNSSVLGSVARRWLQSHTSRTDKYAGGGECVIVGQASLERGQGGCGVARRLLLRLGVGAEYNGPLEERVLNSALDVARHAQATGPRHARQQAAVRQCAVNRSKPLVRVQLTRKRGARSPVQPRDSAELRSSTSLHVVRRYVIRIIDTHAASIHGTTVNRQNRQSVTRRQP